MSNINPGVKITLDKERTLLLDLNAMAAYEEVTGKSLFKGIDIANMGATELRALLWACLVHEEESLTLKQVGAWINATNMVNLAKTLDSAAVNAIPQKQDGDENDPPGNLPNG